MPQQASGMVSMGVGNKYMLDGNGIQQAIPHIKSEIQFWYERVG